MRKLLAGALVAFLLIWNVTAQDGRLNDPKVASKLGVTVQQLHGLRAHYDLSNEDLLLVTPTQLELLLVDLGNPGIDRHAEEQNFRALRMMDEHGRIPPDGLQNALLHRRHRHHRQGGGEDNGGDLLPGQIDPSTNTPSFGTPGPMLAGIQTNGWTWLGPGNIGGRVRAILVHPTDSAVLWCGGVDGGVWKSTNNGVAWFPLNDFMANLAIASMVMDPADPNVIYAGTGEPTYNVDAIRGAGIFKTTDGGATWTQLPSTINSSFQYVGRIAIDPNNSQIILAATRSGIFRSIDGGASWSRPSTTEALNVTYHPTDSSQCLASGYNGNAFYSTNGGVSWFRATGLPAPAGFVAGRVEVAYARSNPSIVYASEDNNSGEIYSSADGGQTFTLQDTGHNFLGSQGWYDNVIWVDPTSPNVVVVGGIDLWRSTSSGGALTKISNWTLAPNSAHADHHAIVNQSGFNGSSATAVYFGNDGGVYRAANVYTVTTSSGWQELNNNLGITQFYGGAGNSNSSVIIGGTQDNGTLRYSGNPEGWTTMYGGDGGFCGADQTNPNYFYGEYVYLQIHRSANGGSSASLINSGITDSGSGSGANFIAPFILDPNNPNTMLAGGVSLWRSINVKAVSPSWSAIKASTGTKISAIAVAPGNSDIIWVGYNNGDVFSTANGTATTPTWTRRDLGAPNLPNRYCERIAISAVNPNKVYATFGGFNSDNVWRTSDGGLTWSNISGNLPPAPVNSIVIAPTDPNTLYVGTEVGIYGTATDGGTWSTGNDGPANVSVDELFWVGNKLVAATHGRGMYSITPALGGANPVAANSTVIGGNGNGVVDPNECNQLTLVVQNVGGSGATNLTGWLSTTTPGVTIVQGTACYPDLPAAAFGTNAAPFQISTDPSFTCGTPVAVTLALAYNGTTNFLNFGLPTAGGDYTVLPSTGASIVPGVADAGNHGDDVVTTLSLPFAFSLYGQSFTNATLCSNGNLQFQSADNQYNNSCLPYSGFSYAIMPFWDDLKTDAAGSGIFTSISGAAPNRIFNIEWRATYFSGGASVNFEVRLFEGQQRFDIVYGTLNGNGSTATAGVQKDSSSYTSFECNAGGLNPGLQLTFQQSCTDGGGGCGSSVLADFTGAPTSGVAPLTVNFSNLSTGATTYAWDFGDGNTSTGTNVSNVYMTAGTYTVTLAAAGGGTTNTLVRSNYVTVTNIPPLITAQPQSQTLPQGANANFSVGATGSPAPSYQWRFGGNGISGATDSSYTLNVAQCSDAGSYDVIVSNPGGSVTSSVAVLTVVSPPEILVQPANATVLPGQPATFSVTAANACGGGLTYQWLFGGATLAGATESTFVRNNAQPVDAGNYTVIITNLAGSVTSAVATLTVNAPAQLAVTPNTLDFGIIVTGTTAQASFVISNAGGAQLTGTASITGGPFAFSGSDGHLDLASFGSTNLTLDFAPLASGTFSNAVVFATDGGDATRTITGQAVDSFAPLILDPAQIGTEFTFSFETITGKTYVIQYTDALDGPGWTVLGSVPGDGTLKRATNSISTAQRFYRLNVQ